MNDYVSGSLVVLPRYGLARSAQVNSNFDALSVGFDRLPTRAALLTGSQNYVELGGSVTAYTATFNASVITAISEGMSIRAKFTPGANTSAATFNLNSLGAVSILRIDGSAIAAGDCSGIRDLIYVSGSWRLSSLAPGLSVTPSAANITFAPAGSISSTNVQSALAELDGDITGLGTSKQAANATLTSLSGLSLVAGDMLYAGGANTLVRLPIGTSGHVLYNNAGVPAWGAPSARLATELSVVSGDILYGSGVNALSRLAKGTDGQVLSLASGVPVWTTVSGIPAGAVAHFAMSAAPSGWLKANGAAVSRATYAALFAAIGTTFGAGDGSTTFALPDLRGEFLRGLDDGRGVDASRALGSAQTDAMQGHKHSGSVISGGGETISVGSGYSSAALGNPTTDGTNGTPRTAAETRPRNIALLACIKY